MVAWVVGTRASATAHTVMAQLASRMAGRIQLTTDGNTEYLSAVWAAFGFRIDYAQLVKEFGPNDKPHTRKYPLIGNPRPHLISTSLVERANLTMRDRMRHFTQQTIESSRNAQNHTHAADLNFMASNFMIPHCTLTLREGKPTTPTTIAVLYAAGRMPENLRAAHDRNDEVLERIYIGRRFRHDTERLERLFEMYGELARDRTA